MSSFNTQWFQDQFAKQDLTQRKVAKSLKVNPSGLSLLLHGKRKLTLEEAALLAKLLNQPLELVLSNAGITTHGIKTDQTLKIQGWVDHKLILHWEMPKGPRHAPNPGFDVKDVEVVRLETAGTASEGIDGALAYYRRSGTVEQDCVGRLCVVQLAPPADGKPGDSWTKQAWRLAVVKRGYFPGAFNLCNLAGAIVHEGAFLESSTPVIWLKF